MRRRGMESSGVEKAVILSACSGAMPSNDLIQAAVDVVGETLRVYVAIYFFCLHSVG